MPPDADNANGLWILAEIYATELDWSIADAVAAKMKTAVEQAEAH